MRTVIRDARYSSAARNVRSVERARIVPAKATDQDRLNAYRLAWRKGLVHISEVPAQYRAQL